MFYLDVEVGLVKVDRIIFKVLRLDMYQEPKSSCSLIKPLMNNIITTGTDYMS